jgi:hypothetical protein
MLGIIERALLTNVLSDELFPPSEAQLYDLMQKGTPLTFVAKGCKGNLAITFTQESYLNPAGRKLKLEPYVRSDKRQIFSFRFDDCIGAIASHGQFGMVLDAADSAAPRGSPVYVFMFHGGRNQQFEYREMYLRSCVNGKCVTFDLENRNCFLEQQLESPQFVQKFAILNPDSFSIETYRQME